MWEVVVQNIGAVYKGDDEAKARKMYENYIYLSVHAEGRVKGEGVDLYLDGEALMSYIPSLTCAKCGKPYMVDDLGLATHLDHECRTDPVTDLDHRAYSLNVN
jgi:hypothetical protein